MKLEAEELLENWQKIINIIETEFSGERKEKLLKMYNDFKDRLLYVPASSREYYHGCFPGGYIVHVLNVIDFALKIDEMWSTSLDNKNIEKSYTREELIFVALNHDFGKVGDEDMDYYMTHNEKWKKDRGELYTINENIVFMELIDRTFYLLQLYDIKLSKTEYLSIKLHEGMYDKANEQYLAGFTKAKQLDNELPILIHAADHIATRYEYIQWSKNEIHKLPTSVKNENKSIDSMVRRYTKHKMPTGIGKVSDNFFGDKQ